MGRAHSTWDSSTHMPVDEAPTVVNARLADSELAVTRVRRGPAAAGETEPYALHDAFLVVVQMQRFGADQDLTVDGRRVTHDPLPAGSLSIYDLDRLWIADLRDAFDCLQFHVPRDTLHMLHDELGGRGRPRLHLPPQRSVVDPAAHQLGKLLMPVFAGPGPDGLARMYAEHLTLAFHTHLLSRYTREHVPVVRSGGKLAPWQQRRATEFLLAHLDQDVGLLDVASACGLSRSQFIQRFKGAMGQTPYRWLVLQRLERAKSLMRGGSMPLSAIALACGFTDQSHLTRHFTRHEGVTPAAWRLRARETHAG